MKFIEINSNNIYKKLNIPFYKRPSFASITIGLISVAIILITQRYITSKMPVEIGLVTEISVATFCMFFLYIVVNQLQSSIAKKEVISEKSREIEAIRNEFTNIASRDIAEASTAIKWGIRSLEPSFDLMKKGEKETLQHIRDKNDHVLEIVRNLVILSRAERGEIVVSTTNTDISGVIENLLHTTHPRVRAIGTKINFEEPVEKIKINVDPIILSDLLLSLFVYCLERTHNPLGEITIKTFLVNDNGIKTVKINISDNASPIPEYMRNNIFDRAIRNPHTGELENTPLGPHVAKILSEILKINIETIFSDTQTLFSVVINEK